MACLRCGSGVLLGLCFASWVIALGGLGAVNWLVCSNYDKTVADITANYQINFPNATALQAAQLQAQLNIPSAAQDVALCARSWRWEWFCMFFQFACVASALVVTCMPTRMFRARFPLGNLFSIATVIIMVAVNENITDVWFFWDSHRMFSEWTGVLRQVYFSAAALVAGWILVVFFNLVWIGFTGDQEAHCEADQQKPITQPETA